MYSQFEGEESQRTDKMHILKGIAIGFGAGLLFATVMTMVVLPDASAAEPSSLMAMPFSAAARASSSRFRGGNPVVVRSWNTRDGRGHPKIGGTAVLEKPSLGGFSQPSYQQPTSAQVPAGQYSPEQLEFLRRTGKMPSQPVQMDNGLKISLERQFAVVCNELSCIKIDFIQDKDQNGNSVSSEQYSPEQLEFLRRVGKLPTMNEPQMDLMRRKMEDQYQRPTASSDSPTFEAAQGRRDGYSRPYKKQRFD
jgi:hypothetical protein